MLVLQDIGQRNVVLWNNYSQLIQYSTRHGRTPSSLVNFFSLGIAGAGGGFIKRAGKDLIVVTFNDQFDGCSLLDDGKSTGI